MANPDDKSQFETVQFSKVRGLAERLEQAWEGQNDSTKGVDLALFLPEPGNPLREPSLVELVKTDLACRWSRGLPTGLEMYLEKFPELGPIDKVSPQLIYEEYRVRSRHGSPAPLDQYKSRFPAQFERLESLIQTDQSQMTAPSTRGQSPTTAAAPVDSPLAMINSGALVGGHYTLTKRIGTGGFGEVWLGNDIHGNIPKAIKIITRSVESDEAKTELHALEIIKRLNHPYLLRTEGFFAEQERLIVVMELAEGSLREMLKKSKKESGSGLPVEKLLVYLKHAAEALDYLHEEGIFHRDIKPENILVVGKIAKVADFGLAKLAANRQSTKTNFAGTSAYSAPETWKGRVTSKSDLYSLAATYGELRLGRQVFKGSTIYEFMVEHLQSDPDLDPMPEAEKQVLLKALAKDPSDRYATCSEFLRELERAVAEPGSLPAGVGGASGSSTPGRSRTSDRSTGSILPGADRSGTTSPAKPPSWKTAAEADDAGAEPEAEPQAYRRSRRRRGPNLWVQGAIVLAVLAIGTVGASVWAYSSLESRVQAKVAAKDFAGAIEAIDGGGVLTAPFRETMREAVQKKGVELAEKAKKSDNLDELTAIAEAMVEAFPSDDKAPALLNAALKERIPDLVAREKFAEAYARLNNLRLDVPAKRDQLADVSRRWLKRAWDELDREDYAAAKQTTAEFLKVDPTQKDAAELSDLLTAAESVRALILKGQYREIMEKIPRTTPPAGQKLANQLRGEVKSAWLKQAEQLVAAENFTAAQRSLADFAVWFKNDAQANALRKTSLNQLVKGYLADERYDDALALLAKTDFEFSDLVDAVKTSWRDAEVKRFAAGDEATKERAILGLSKLSSQFGSDFGLQDDYRKYRGEFVRELLPKIDAGLEAKNYPRTLDLIARAEPYALDPAQKNRLQSLRVLALVEDPKTAPGERKTIEKLLRDVMKQPETAAHLERIASGVVKLGAADAEFADAIRPELVAFRDAIPDDKLPADYWKLPGMVKTDPSAAQTGSRKILADARKLFASQEYDQSLRVLGQIDLRKEADRSLKADCYALYAKLGEKGALTREQVLSLESAAGEFPNIKPSVSKAMTQTIARSWADWPTGKDAWLNRVKDADIADASQPIVLAYKAEALIEAGKPVDFKLPPGSADEKAYVDYVRACAAAATNKRDDLIVAARSLEKLPVKQPWLAPGRRQRAAKILESAALETTKAADGSRRLFESAQEANQAYAWLEKSLQLDGKTVADGASLPWGAELTLALAAACKSPPAFDVSKTLGDDLLARRRRDLGGERINLVLSNPNAFAADLKAFKAEGEIGVDEVSGMLIVGESQMELSPDVAEVTQRQALLYSLKGWALEQAPQKNNEAIFTAYGKAAKLDPDNAAVLVAKGRFGAIVAREAAEIENNTEAKRRLLQQGIQTADAVLRKNFAGDEAWADLCLQRSQLALDLGNLLFSVNQPEGLKDSFIDARDFALKARDAKTPAKKIADVWLALGNAYEDLAHFARVDVAKNYEEAAKAHDQAAKLNSEYAYNAGRCRYRWANDGSVPLDDAAKKLIVNTALLNLAPVAANKKSRHAAEASYWEGYVNWYLLNYPKAYESFARALALGSKDGSALWARYSLDGIVGLAKNQVKADPDRSLRWLDDAEETYRPMKNLPAFAGAASHLDEAAAESLQELAKKDLAAGDAEKFKSHADRAFGLKHPKLGHLIAIERAAGLKANRKALKLSPEALTEIYDQTLAAIDAAPSLSAAEKQTWRAGFEKNWKASP